MVLFPGPVFLGDNGATDLCDLTHRERKTNIHDICEETCTPSL